MIGLLMLLTTNYGVDIHFYDNVNILFYCELIMVCNEFLNLEQKEIKNIMISEIALIVNI